MGLVFSGYNGWLFMHHKQLFLFHFASVNFTDWDNTAYVYIHLEHNKIKKKRCHEY